MQDKSRLDELLQKFPSLHILVVGDFFLDKYLSLDPALSETSLETGLEAYQVVEIRHSPGAAGTVVSNLRALESQVSVVGVIGLDGEGFDLKQGLIQRGVAIEGLIERPERFTPTYTKPMLRSATPGGSERELNRLDIKNRRPLPGDLEAAVIAQLDRLVPAVDGVVIADQVQERNCGVITDKVRAALARLAEQYPTKVFVADSRVRIGEFERVIIKPNMHEAREAVGSLEDWKAGGLEGWKVGDYGGDNGLAAARSYGGVLFAQNQKPVFITLGAQGILVVTQDGFEHVPGIPVSGEIDVVGAGDSVMAGVAAGLGAGGTAAEAAFIGNMAASITIQQLGTTGTASREQLRQRMKMVDGR
ncbi:MAG: carbohydrate kinase [Anaerolineae bacterium]|nr:carbohydrate kinase [Anaerolineae bacterium]